MPTKPRYRVPTEERLTKAAVHYLDRYASSEANLRAVLLRKVSRACHALGHDPDGFADMIDTVVAKCVRTGFVNDRAYAEMKVASLQRKGNSRRKIEAHLTAKGIDRDMVQSVLADSPNDDTAAAQKYARRRRFGPYREPAKRAERRDRDLAAMCRAGFSFEIARQVIDATAQDVDTDPTH